MFNQLTRLAIALCCGVLFSASATAQCVAQVRTGCAGEGAPTCIGRVSTATGFQIGCPRSTLPCSGGGPNVTLFGTCAAPVQVPAPLGCGSCSLIVAPWGTFLDPITVPAGLPVGASFCMQCGCVAVPPRGALCVNLSQAVMVTVLP